LGDRRTRLRLWVVQSAFGDCLVVEGRAGDRTRRILIDGGPGGTYQAALRPVLVDIGKAGGRVDVAVLSHIDNDHILGLLDLFEELRNPPPDGSPGPLPPIDGLWHNSFARAVGGADIEPKVRAVLRDGGRFGAAMPAVAGVLRGVGEGDALRAAALALGIPLGAGFRNGQVMVGLGQPPGLDPLQVTVVGPSQSILDRLRTQWLGWLARHQKRGVVREAVRTTSIALDQSVPNLSSIVLLVELDGRSMLLTGDARADQVLEGMQEAGTLGADGRRHVSILKMPHHGSIRNITADFLRAVTADTYVISADGRYGNPDADALALIVEVAMEQGRRIELAMTNTTTSSERLLASRPPAKFGYRVRTLRPGAAALPLDARVHRRRPG
jgi:Metallo-beta-lactamase superfamily